MLSTVGALLAASSLPLLVSAKPLPRAFEQSTVFHNTQNASSPDFVPLHHLAGTAPYWDSPGVELNPQSPYGCFVEKAAYLIRHSNIEANEFDYEDSLEPFLSKLKNFTSASSANASVFRNTSLAFLETYSPLLVNETAQVSHVPASGRKDAFELGKQFEKYLGHLLPPWTDDKDSTSNQTYKLWAATAQRDLDTAASFQEGLFSNSTYNSSEIVEVGEGKLSAANTLVPHKTCDSYSGSAGSKEQKVWKNLYAQPIADRLNAEGSLAAFNWTVADVFAAQQLCGYDTVIAGEVSPWCNTTAFTNEDWLSFEYANDLMYHYSLGYGFEASPSLGMPYLLAVSDFLLPDNDFEAVGPNFTQNSNYTTPDPAKVPSKSQALYLSFAHREEPAFLATALGIFNNSVGIAGNLTASGIPTNETMSSTVNDKTRAWKTSEILPFLGHVGIERVSCPAMAPGNQSYVRVLVNHAPIPIPDCKSGPESSCPSDLFADFIEDRKALFGDFVGACNLTSQANATDVFSIFQGIVPSE